MRFRPNELEALFKSFKKGDTDALDAIFASEKVRLFDYLMRMTGQLSKSNATAEEATNSVAAVIDREESLQEVLVILYKTARNFTIEVWNAETSRLENSAYLAAMNGKGDRSTSTLIALENVVRSLPPKQREILLLHERLGFSTDEVAEITGFDTSDVEELFAQALGIAEAAMAGDAEKVPELLTKLLAFEVPEESTMATQNLSMVFKDLKKSSRSTPGGWLKLFVGFVFIAAVGFAAYQYQLVFDLIQKLIGP
jgi:DNA-directed RNA polymerase specialized sigma24 family protein